MNTKYTSHKKHYLFILIIYILDDVFLIKANDERYYGAFGQAACKHCPGWSKEGVRGEGGVDS